MPALSVRLFVNKSCVFAAVLPVKEQNNARSDRENCHDDLFSFELDVEDGKQSCRDQPDAQKDHAKVFGYFHMSPFIGILKQMMDIRYLPARISSSCRVDEQARPSALRLVYSSRAAGENL
jgi:hypothetical protein